MIYFINLYLLNENVANCRYYMDSDFQLTNKIDNCCYFSSLEEAVKSRVALMEQLDLHMKKQIKAVINCL
jgi:hypothetical protein